MNMREQMARKMFLSHDFNRGAGWDIMTGSTNVSEEVKSMYFKMVDAALDVLMNPTDEVLDAGNCAEWYGGIQGHLEGEHAEVKRVLQGAIQGIKDGK